eukprot:4853681-Amphidinium_carterae.1
MRGADQRLPWWHAVVVGGCGYKHVKTLARPSPGPLAKNAAQRHRLGRNLFPQSSAQGELALHVGTDWGDFGQGHKRLQRTNLMSCTVSVTHLR